MEQNKSERLNVITDNSKVNKFLLSENEKLKSDNKELLECCNDFLQLVEEWDMRPEDECLELASKMEKIIQKLTAKP